MRRAQGGFAVAQLVFCRCSIYLSWRGNGPDYAGANRKRTCDMSTIELNNSGFNFELGFATLATRWNRWKAQRETRVELNNLSERQLEDIGLNRADIDTVVSAI